MKASGQRDSTLEGSKSLVGVSSRAKGEFEDLRLTKDAISWSASGGEDFSSTSKDDGELSDGVLSTGVDSSTTKSRHISV